MCEKILVSSFSLKRHAHTIHQNNLTSTESSQVVITKNSIDIAPKAKIALIKEQAEKIEALKTEYKMLENVKSELLHQLIAERIE